MIITRDEIRHRISNPDWTLISLALYLTLPLRLVDCYSPK